MGVGELGGEVERRQVEAGLAISDFLFFFSLAPALPEVGA